ncbi:MAG: uroporphyrinogen decarboxylase family protein [Anaerolineae bacterium]
MSQPVMSPRERVLTAVAHSEPDRVPADGFFRPEVWERLKAAIGAGSDEAARRHLGLDVVRASIEPGMAFRARSRPAPPDLAGLGSGSRQWLIERDGRVCEDEWGIWKHMPLGGLYFSYVRHPLADADSPAGYRFPDPTAEERYENVASVVSAWGRDYPLIVEQTNFFKTAWELRGFERLLTDLYDDPGFVEALLDRVYEFRVEESLQLARHGVDIISFAGDVASQQGMMMSPAVWRRFFKPRLAGVIDAVRRECPAVRFFFHSDGDVSAIVGDVADIGFDILDPVQPECMDPAWVKREYGDRLALHATVSSQQTLPFGTPDDVRREVRLRFETCGQNGGLILAPNNVVQADVPTENLLALYETIQECRYR